VDSLDWKNYGADSIVNTVVNHKALDDGAIILLHNGAKYTTSALQAMIDGLKNKGYNFVTIGELIYKEGYKIDHTGKQIYVGDVKENQ
jgi:peptidoglycan/xylan/chitin deacetylase (PgdA/CDA1 family)